MMKKVKLRNKENRSQVVQSIFLLQEICFFLSYASLVFFVLVNHYLHKKKKLNLKNIEQYPTRYILNPQWVKN